MNLYKLIGGVFLVFSGIYILVINSKKELSNNYGVLMIILLILGLGVREIVKSQSQKQR